VVTVSRSCCCAEVSSCSAPRGSRARTLRAAPRLTTPARWGRGRRGGRLAAGAAPPLAWCPAATARPRAVDRPARRAPPPPRADRGRSGAHDRSDVHVRAPGPRRRPPRVRNTAVIGPAERVRHPCALLADLGPHAGPQRRDEALRRGGGGPRSVTQPLERAAAHLRVPSGEDAVRVGLEQPHVQPPDMHARHGLELVEVPSEHHRWLVALPE
jgi:hypothetical protein